MFGVTRPVAAPISPPLNARLILERDKLAPHRVSEVPDRMAVAFADEGGVKVLAVEIDEAQDPAVGVHGVAGAILDELHRLSVQPGLRESGCFQPEMFHRFGGWTDSGVSTPMSRTVRFPP